MRADAASAWAQAGSYLSQWGGGGDSAARGMSPAALALSPADSDWTQHSVGLDRAALVRDRVAPGLNRVALVFDRVLLGLNRAALVLGLGALGLEPVALVFGRVLLGLDQAWRLVTVCDSIASSGGKKSGNFRTESEACRGWSSREWRDHPPDKRRGPRCRRAPGFARLCGRAR